MAFEFSLLAMGFVVLCRLAWALGTVIGRFSLFAERVLSWTMFGLALEALPSVIEFATKVDKHAKGKANPS